MKDDLSADKFISAKGTAGSEVVKHALIKWIAALGGMMWIVYDLGAHFTAVVMKILTEQDHLCHHLTTAYCPLIVHRPMEPKNISVEQY